MPSRRRTPATAVQAPLETYLREINETSLLSADDEKRLARAIAAGDALSRDHMVRANLRLVVNIARGYANRGLPLPDLIEEGNLGLLRAVEGFDPDVGTRFSTYASYWIKQSIKRALINSGKTIRIPAYMVELLSKWRRATARLSEILGRTPTPEEIARLLGLARKKLPIIKKAIHVHTATPHTEQEDGGWSLGELLHDDGARCPADVLLDADTLAHVLERIDRLDDRAARIIRLRFGLGGGEPLTLKEIGAELGLTRERVRQIEAETLASLAAAIDGEPEANLRLRRGA
jgi:RNA polymerase primary sigma factor